MFGAAPEDGLVEPGLADGVAPENEFVEDELDQG